MEGQQEGTQENPQDEKAIEFTQFDSEEEKAEVKAVLSGKDQQKVDPKLMQDNNDDVDIRKMIGDMKMPQKVKLAMMGNKECRMLLINDKNRVVQESVLKNARITEGEIEDICKNPQTTVDVIRAIVRNKDWISEYHMKKALVFNPKTPIAISMGWIKLIRNNDLKILAKSKSLPQVVTSAAQKKLSDAAKKQ